MLVHIYLFCRTIKNDKGGGENRSISGAKGAHVEEIK